MSTKPLTLARMMRDGTKWIRINHLYPTKVDGGVAIEAGVELQVEVNRSVKQGVLMTGVLPNGTHIHSWLAWPEPGKVVIGPGRKVTIYLDDEHKRILLEYLAP